MNSAYKNHLPPKIKVLFLAEAPGNSLKHFYLNNTNLYRTLHKAFADVYGPFNSHRDFLDFFKSLGCYLDHLSPIPMDRSSDRVRQESRNAAVASLGKRLASYQPSNLIILMKSIEPQVRQAIELSGIDTLESVTVTSYPAGSEFNRRTCIQDVSTFLKNRI